MQVYLPQKTIQNVHDRLCLVKGGCRLFSLLDTVSDWCSERPCRFRACSNLDGDDQGDEHENKYAASWAPLGITFCTFQADEEGLSAQANYETPGGCCAPFLYTYWPAKVRSP